MLATATGKTFEPELEGEYAVITTVGDCNYMSDALPVTFAVTGTEQGADPVYHYAPNPADRRVGDHHVVSPVHGIDLYGHGAICRPHGIRLAGGANRHVANAGRCVRCRPQWPQDQICSVTPLASVFQKFNLYPVVELGIVARNRHEHIWLPQACHGNAVFADAMVRKVLAHRFSTQFGELFGRTRVLLQACTLK